MKNRSYTSSSTGNVKPYRTYEKDFNNPGDFKEVIRFNKINFQVSLYSGKLQGGKWIHINVTDGYQITVRYHNRNHIEVNLDAYSVADEKMKETIDFIKNAAKIFYLVNNYVKNDSSLILKAHLKWETIEKVIQKTEPGTTTRREALSWSKIMDIVEAKSLLDHLKITVAFPSRSSN